MSMPSGEPPTRSSPMARRWVPCAWPPGLACWRRWPGQGAWRAPATTSGRSPTSTSSLPARSRRFAVALPSREAGHLLVVDDNRVNRLLLGRALEQLGHTVSFAENGREGLEALRQRAVDLVLLDIEMPEMNGYQVLEALAADPLLRDLPVVMMSSVEEVDSVARCIEMGAEDYLFKPVNPVLLKARIRSSLEKKRLRD